MTNSQTMLPVLLLALLALSRWPGLLPPNFSVVYALAFCAGVYLPGRMAWGLPLSLLLFTDLLLNAHYGASLVSGWMAFNYAAYALLIGLGRRFSKHRSWLHLLGGGLLGALLFYFVTNTAAWFNPLPGPYPQVPYPRTILGWIQALTVGTSPWPPTWTFFRNTLWSGGLFTGLFVLGMKLDHSLTPVSPKADEPDQEAETPEAEPANAVRP